MYAKSSINAFFFSDAIFLDPNSLGPASVQTLITGGTGSFDLQVALTDEPEGRFETTSVNWSTIATLTAGVDNSALTNIPGPVRAVRVDASLLSEGTVLIEVRQASRV